MGTRCIECKKTVRPKKHALCCDTCERWQHRTCKTDLMMYHRVPPPSKSDDDSSNKDNSTNEDSQQQKPKCVSASIWEKFQTLQKRTDDVTKRSTEKRIKHLQRKVIDNVHEKITFTEDKDILREHDVKFGPPVKDTVVISGKKRKLNDKNIQESTSSTSTSEENNQHWSEIKQYLDVNKHLQDVDRGKHAPKTKLDDAIDDAISNGNFDTAEKLSDQLAVRDFGKKISDAIDARDYVKAKKEEEESVKAKKKKSLPWGFVHKQRWETKSNM